MAVITISRQFGCGGEYVAERVAEKLKFKLLHKELIKIASILMSADEEKIKQFDEEQHSSVRSFMSKYFDLSIFSDFLNQTDYSQVADKPVKDVVKLDPETFFGKYSSDDTALDSESFQTMMIKIINKAADTTNSVIVGRGGVCILENNPLALHFRLVAKLEDRIKWLSEREKITEKKAKENIEEIDMRKRKYFKHYFDRSIDDHWMYHGILNLSKLDIEEAALAIVEIAKIKFKI